MKYGLVLSGGGAKGSYEVGVWKALQETGAMRHISSISGTSVGALNATLIAQGELDKAEKVWSELNKDFVYPDIDKIGDAIDVKGIIKHKMFPPMAAIKKVKDIMIMVQFIGDKVKNFKGEADEEIWKIVANVFSAGFLKTSRLEQIIDNNIDYRKVKKYGYSIFATSYNQTDERKEVFELKNASNKEEMSKFLLASAAIPGGFDPVTIDGKEYLDGGFPVIGENIPVSPLVSRGIKNLIVVHLRDGEYLDEEEKKGINNLIEIVPSVDLGNFFSGTLNFSQESIKRRKEVGYLDAIYALSQTKSRICNRKKLIRIIEKINADALEYLKNSDKEKRKSEREIIFIDNDTDGKYDDIAQQYGYIKEKEQKEGMVILRKKVLPF